MRRITENWAVVSANAFQTDINPKPPYQRGPVWSVNHQQLFVDSILRDYDIPKLYLRAIEDSEYTWEVIDGQQRLRAIWDFFANRFPLSTDSDPIDGQVIAKLFHNDLHHKLRQRLQTYQLAVVIIDDATDSEVEDMFIRLQNGVPLNSAEKRHAISGTMRDFIHNLASNHPLMTESVRFPNNRYAHDESIAQMMLIEMEKSPTLLRHTQLKHLYETRKTFNTGSAEAKKLRTVLNFLKRAFPEQAPELNKVNLISLYTLASGALTRYALSNRADEFGQWFIDFEKRRQADDELSEDERDSRLLSYQLAITNQTAGVASQNERQRILTEDLAASLPDLRLRDNQRTFSTEQRQAIFRLADRKCANPDGSPDCAVECTWDNFHADHIIPHSQGGATTVANGQLLCPSCNLKKGAKSP